MANPYVFIVGCARSGTTLLRRMVNAHPQMAILNESHWIPKLFDNGSGLTSEGFVTPELIPHLVNHPRFVRLHVTPEKLLELAGSGEQPVSYADFVARIFDLYGEHKGRLLVGDKTPGYVRRIETLHNLWPAARFVHLIRDGRDVCLSMLDWPKVSQIRPGIFSTWQDDCASTAAFWWELNVRLGREAAKPLGPGLYYEMRYESLVRNPAEECKALCAFLDVPFDDAMLRFHEGRTKDDPSLSTKRAWRPITAGLRDWQSQMSAENVERFEAAAGELLDELGYPRAFAHLRPEAVEHASKIRDSLIQDPNWKEAAPCLQAEEAEPATPATGIPDSQAGHLAAAGS